MQLATNILQILAMGLLVVVGLLMIWTSLKEMRRSDRFWRQMELDRENNMKKLQNIEQELETALETEKKRGKAKPNARKKT